MLVFIDIHYLPASSQKPTNPRRFLCFTFDSNSTSVSRMRKKKKKTLRMHNSIDKTSHILCTQNLSNPNHFWIHWWSDKNEHAPAWSLVLHLQMCLYTHFQRRPNRPNTLYWNSWLPSPILEAGSVLCLSWRAAKCLVTFFALLI